MMCFLFDQTSGSGKLKIAFLFFYFFLAFLTLKSYLKLIAPFKTTKETLISPFLLIPNLLAKRATIFLKSDDFHQVLTCKYRCSERTYCYG